MKLNKVEMDSHTGISIPVEDLSRLHTYRYQLALKNGEQIDTIMIQVRPGKVISIDDGMGESYQLSVYQDHISSKLYHLTATLYNTNNEVSDLMIIVPTNTEAYLSGKIE